MAQMPLFNGGKIVQHVRSKKWKAEWIDPNPGLVDYVQSQNLVVRWKEQKAFFRDEERARQLRADNERHGYKEDSPLATVLYEVFESLGENEVSFYRGVLSGRPDALDRLRERAGFAPLFKLKLGGRAQKGGDQVLHALI